LFIYLFIYCSFFFFSEISNKNILFLLFTLISSDRFIAINSRYNPNNPKHPPDVTLRPLNPPVISPIIIIMAAF